MHATVALVSVALVVGVPTVALAASPSIEHGSPVVVGATTHGLPLRLDEEESDRLESAAAATAAVTRVHASLTRYDEVTVTWAVAATGRRPSRFIVELVPAADAPIVAVSVGGGLRKAVLSRVASATRFQVRVVAVAANGLTGDPATGNSVLTKSMVAAAVDAAAAATRATDAAERAERAASRADSRLARAGGRWGPLVIAAARAHRHADRLRRVAASASSEATRARNRLVHIS
ncbi:MAG: fibronectin type III domain-containing protein [Naasia sp.]